jgi:hypothetical protein
MVDELRSITEPAHLWSRDEVLARPSPVPPVPGVYGWYFRELPCRTDLSACVSSDGFQLLYVGISPKAPPSNGGRPSQQSLSTRIRYHFRGNAYGSTLRLTLGVLLGLRLRLVGSGRLTFGPEEADLSAWMDENARVTWAAVPEPWIAERALIETLDLPLNLDGNRSHAFAAELSALRAAARATARVEAVPPPAVK